MTTRNDVLIIGGGLIGLAIALELRLRGASVTLLSRNFAEAASHAAAGMLAPQAEKILPGAMLDLCLRSRRLYPDWIHKLEELTGLDAGYWACGILAPVYEQAQTDRISPDEVLTGAECVQTWLDRVAIHHHQSGLGPEVAAGWWYPQDAQVDNRALTNALWTAVQDLGVQVQEGVTVEAIQRENQRVVGVRSTAGDFQAGHYVLATGAWTQDLLSIPVYPKKGQMLSVRVPVEVWAQGLPLQTILFGDQSYIVPRRNGLIVIGATSETVGFTSNNTPAGVQALLSRATRLYPGLQDFPIQEFWWGFRPATPDELPILGTSPYENLTLATGHYRNGILLAPVTALLMANWIEHQQADPLLAAFHWARFTA